ncbi:uncharacterized protein [Euphorbia lathyris]|uniref:uncharacterized protein isoform X2 n=1 Tax=Euphorbia lathyris TaxID=212925 RepID=UPI00331448A5
METNLATLMGKVKLTDNEESVLDLESESNLSEVKDTKPSLIDRVLSSKPLNIRGMGQAFLGAWRIKAFQLKEMGNGLFLCEFDSRRNKDKVLNDGPWHFERQLVVFRDMNGIDQLSEANLDCCDFWVRILDLPLNRRDVESITLVASRLGELIEIDRDCISSWSKFVRVKISDIWFSRTAI